MKAMYETLEKAMTSTVAQMQATQDLRDKKMHQSQEKLTESPALLMATFARDTLPLYITGTYRSPGRPDFCQQMQI